MARNRNRNNTTTSETPAAEEAPASTATETPKPKRERRVTPKGELSKDQINGVAARVEKRLNAIAKNYGSALETASTRLVTKYSGLIKEELLGLDPRVIERVEIPSFYVEPKTEDTAVTTEAAE